MLVRVAAALAVAAVAAGATDRASSTRINVYAATSLAEALPQIHAHKYSFGGSNTLAAQIKQGAPADVFASADPSLTQDLFRLRLVEKPLFLVSNTLVLAVPRSNPAGIRSVFDLRRKPVKLVLAAPRVPAGRYARQTLRKLGLAGALTKVVSEEPDVKSVVAKIALREADAGIVYATDVRPAAGKVAAVRIPAWSQPKIRYEIAVVRSSGNREAARAFVKLVTTGKRARAILARAGFGVR